MIRRIMIPDELVLALDTSGLGRMFDLVPEETRRVQGSVALVFPGYANERVIYFVPQLRRYLRKAHDELPHLLYYLAPDPEFDAVAAFLAAHADEDCLVRQPEPVVQVDERLIQLFARRLVTVAEFCERLADNTPTIIGALVAGFDKELARKLRDYALSTVGRSSE